MGLKIGPPCRIASPARPGLGEKLPLTTCAVNGEFFGLFEASGEVAVPGNDGVMLCGAHGWLLFRGVRKPPRHGTARGCLFRTPARLRGYAHVHVAGAVSVTGEGGHGGGRYSQLLRVVSSSSKRRLVEPLLLGCGLVSRSGLRGGAPLVAAARTRPVLLDVVPLLALRRRARRGLAMLDRDDTERVGRRLRPLLLLTVLVGVGA